MKRRTFRYGLVETSGPTVVLLHGWGLAHHSYRACAEEIALRGFRVVVPDLPGFGGSSDLPLHRLSLGAYSAAMREFLEDCHDIGGEPVHLVGHSFGGAVAAQIAHDAPDLVKSVVLVSSATGATWHRINDEVKLLAERPIWHWGVHLVHEFPVSRFPVAALDVLRDLSHNLVWHLPNMGVVAGLIRRSDLRQELSIVKESGVPVSVVWAESDNVITRASFDDQCSALGCDGTVVDGNHNWPLTQPSSFARTVCEFLSSAPRAPSATRG